MMKKKEAMKKVTAVAMLAIVAILSFFVLAGPASDAESYVNTIASIDDKKATVMGVTATAAAASTALAAIPGDVTTPIATQIMQISEYLFLVVCFLVLEKSLLTVMGFLGFKILLPLACVLMTVYLFWKNPTLKVLALKIMVFAVLIVCIIPLSVRISDMIYEVNQVTVDELNQQCQEFIPDEKAESMEQTVPQTEPAQSEENESWLGGVMDGFTDKVEEATDKVGEFVGNVTDKVGNVVSNTAEEAKELLNRFIDAIALFVITYCAIPVFVVLVMIWFVKFLFQIQIPMPDVKHRQFGRKDRIEAEKHAIEEA